MDVGEAWTRVTGAASLALYAAAIGMRVRAGGRRGWLAAARWAWTSGCVVFLAHVLCAFGLIHDWRHAAAYAATAQRTFDAVGWLWGGGLYANYAFGVAWVVDVAWWWRGLRRYETRPRAVAWTIHGFMAWMAIQSTVVFGRGVVRWLGLAAMVWLGGMWLRGRWLQARCRERPDRGE